jgi:hypothetical protein
MISKDDAVSLSRGTELYHVYLKDSYGKPLHVRVNGACKTWATRPKQFRLPIKYGFRDCFYLHDGDEASKWVRDVRAIHDAGDFELFRRLMRGGIVRAVRGTVVPAETAKAFAEVEARRDILDVLDAGGWNKQRSRMLIGKTRSRHWEAMRAKYDTAMQHPSEEDVA